MEKEHRCRYCNTPLIEGPPTVWSAYGVIAFLRKHAPRCLARKCGACGAPRGIECHGFDELGRRYDMAI